MGGPPGEGRPLLRWEGTPVQVLIAMYLKVPMSVCLRVSVIFHFHVLWLPAIHGSESAAQPLNIWVRLLLPIRMWLHMPTTMYILTHVPMWDTSVYGGV